MAIGELKYLAIASMRVRLLSSRRVSIDQDNRGQCLEQQLQMIDFELTMLNDP